MQNDPMGWVDDKEKMSKEAASDLFFEIKEGDNRVQILTHLPALFRKWNGNKYDYSDRDGEGYQTRGVGWVLQDGKIKQAELPYTVVRAIREFQQSEETSFDSFPMPYAINIKTKDAGTKDVSYTVIPSRKETPIESEIVAELAKKWTPEEIVQRKIGKAKGDSTKPDSYPNNDDINPEDIPF